MTVQQFQALKYGDIILDTTDPSWTLLVIHTSEDSHGNTVAVGVIKGYPATQVVAESLRLVQKANPPQETALIDPDGKTRRGFLKTMPEVK